MAYVAVARREAHASAQTGQSGPAKAKAKAQARQTLRDACAWVGAKGGEAATPAQAMIR